MGSIPTLISDKKADFIQWVIDIHNQVNISLINSILLKIYYIKRKFKTSLMDSDWVFDLLTAVIFSA